MDDLDRQSRLLQSFVDLNNSHGNSNDIYDSQLPPPPVDGIATATPATTRAVPALCDCLAGHILKNAMTTAAAMSSYLHQRRQQQMQPELQRQVRQYDSLINDLHQRRQQLQQQLHKLRQYDETSSSSSLVMPNANPASSSVIQNDPSTDQTQNRMTQSRQLHDATMFEHNVRKKPKPHRQATTATSSDAPSSSSDYAGLPASSNISGLREQEEQNEQGSGSEGKDDEEEEEDPQLLQLLSVMANSNGRDKRVAITTNTTTTATTIGHHEYYNRDDKVWLEHYEWLKQYESKHGHCNVPEQAGKLGRWVRRQRQAQRSRLLFPNRRTCVPKERLEKRKQLLNDIGFVWSSKLPPPQHKEAYGIDYDNVTTTDWATMAPNDVIWVCNYKKLVEYKEEHGHCLVKTERRYTKRGLSDIQLGTWVANQRAFHRKGKLRKDRFKALDKLGFTWRIRKEGGAKGKKSSCPKK